MGEKQCRIYLIALPLYLKGTFSRAKIHLLLFREPKIIMAQ